MKAEQHQEILDHIDILRNQVSSLNPRRFGATEGTDEAAAGKPNWGSILATVAKLMAALAAAFAT